MRLLCNECQQSCSSEIPDDTLVRAYVMCPECLELIDEDIANKFLQKAEKVGAARLKRRQVLVSSGVRDLSQFHNVLDNKKKKGKRQ